MIKQPKIRKSWIIKSATKIRENTKKQTRRETKKELNDIVEEVNDV